MPIRLLARMVEIMNNDLSPLSMINRSLCSMLRSVFGSLFFSFYCCYSVECKNILLILLLVIPSSLPRIDAFVPHQYQFSNWASLTLFIQLLQQIEENVNNALNSHNIVKLKVFKLFMRTKNNWKTSVFVHIHYQLLSGNQKIFNFKSKIIQWNE